jgi:hypothetical protein
MALVVLSEDKDTCLSAEFIEQEPWAALKLSVKTQALLRRGLPMMTSRMMAVLKELRTAQDSDTPFVMIVGVHKRTLNSLIARDWIVADPGLDGWRYRITGRGLKALAVYEPVVKRTDGLCPRCGKRPRRLRKTGVLAPYCKQCERRMVRRKYALGIGRLRPEGTCARCHKRPRFVTSTGRVYCYCRHCKNLIRRHEHRRQRKQLLARILAGEHIACIKEGCDAPRHVFNNTVSDYCLQHWREYMTVYNDRRRAHSRAAASRKSQGRS